MRSDSRTPSAARLAAWNQRILGNPGTTLQLVKNRHCPHNSRIGRPLDEKSVFRPCDPIPGVVSTIRKQSTWTRMYGPPHDCKKKSRARRQVCANVFGLNGD